MTYPRTSGPRQILSSAITSRTMLAPSPVDAMLAIAKKAGVGVKAIAKAAGGGHIPTIDHLRLCAAIEIDPMAGLGPTLYGMGIAFPEPADFDPHLLSLGLQLRQQLNRHTYGEACKAMGVKAGTLQRLIAGRKQPIGATLRACSYVVVHPFGYFKPAQNFLSGSVSRETGGQGIAK